MNAALKASALAMLNNPHPDPPQGAIRAARGIQAPATPLRPTATRETTATGFAAPRKHSVEHLRPANVVPGHHSAGGQGRRKAALRFFFWTRWTTPPAKISEVPWFCYDRTSHRRPVVVVATRLRHTLAMNQDERCLYFGKVKRSRKGIQPCGGSSSRWPTTAWIAPSGVPWK